MLSKRMQEALNHQIDNEAKSSQVYLTMASWAEGKGLPGVAEFFYQHAHEERMHMLKLVRYVNERGGTAVIPAVDKVETSFESLKTLFEDLLKHEIHISEKINEVVGVCLEEKDYSTHNFMQWYVSEQLEEEALARLILDKLNIIGEDKGGMYLFDRDIQKLHNEVENEA